MHAPCSFPRSLKPVAVVLLTWSYFALTGSPALAQSDESSGKQASTWRVTSRLGYGPTAATAQAAEFDPKTWALQQIDAAYSASQRPPIIPAELSRFNAPISDIARDFKDEREARKNNREQAAKLAAGSPANAGNAGNAADAQGFSREMQQTAVAWRLMSCSDPAMENPLLARMTEFWFNHLNVFVGKGPVRPFVGHYVVNAIRPHALGKFEDLMLASAQHPAMLLYLDQAKQCARHQ